VSRQPGASESRNFTGHHLASPVGLLSLILFQIADALFVSFGDMKKPRCPFGNLGDQTLQSLVSLAQSFHLPSELLDVLIEALHSLLVVPVQRGQQFPTLSQRLKSFVDVQAASAIMLNSKYVLARMSSQFLLARMNVLCDDASMTESYASQFARKGGQARAKKLTPEQRSESARKAVEARWAKQKKLVAEITEGTKKLLKKARARKRSQTRTPN